MKKILMMAAALAVACVASAQMKITGGSYKVETRYEANDPYVVLSGNSSYLSQSNGPVVGNSWGALNWAHIYFPVENMWAYFSAIAQANFLDSNNNGTSNLDNVSRIHFYNQAFAQDIFGFGSVTLFASVSVDFEVLQSGTLSITNHFTDNGAVFKVSDVTGGSIVEMSPFSGPLTLVSGRTYRLSAKSAMQGQFSDFGMTTRVTATFTPDAPTNQAPVADDDPYGFANTGGMYFSDKSVLDNDIDADGDALTATLVSGPSNGTLVFHGDGTFTYTPLTPYFYGTDTFTYRATDGTDPSEIATVTIEVRQPGAGGFITGGGKLAGVKRTFGFVAKVTNGVVGGNLEFQDHLADVNIKSNSVNWVYTPNILEGFFSGTCSVNGVSGHTFFVELHDGTDDFTIWVFDATNSVVYTSGGELSGGNVKIHWN